MSYLQLVFENRAVAQLARAPRCSVGSGFESLLLHQLNKSSRLAAIYRARFVFSLPKTMALRFGVSARAWDRGSARREVPAISSKPPFSPHCNNSPSGTKNHRRLIITSSCAPKYHRPGCRAQYIGHLRHDHRQTAVVVIPMAPGDAVQIGGGGGSPAGECACKAVRRIIAAEGKRVAIR